MKQLPVKIESRFFSLKLDMKVWRIVVAEVHSNDNAEKS